MTTENNHLDPTEEQADELLRQLMRLKSYETPDPARVTRNKQNILREIRQSSASRRGSLLDRLELNIPWFFAEPKYGIAALFVAFMGLQYLGLSARDAKTSTGIYTSTSAVADYVATPAATNHYPTLPRDYQLFGRPQGDQSVVPAGFEYKKEPPPREAL